MKKMITLCMTAAMIFMMCACGAQSEPEVNRSPYADVIARLEVGDYDGARSLIDAMEGKKAPSETEFPEMPSTEPAVQMETITAATQPDSTVTADLELVELTEYNVRNYFEFAEDYIIGEKSNCTQYITLKEEYRDRLLSVENVLLEVSCLRCDAYGKINLEEEEFRAEYYDAISREKETRTIELDANAMGWITGITEFSKKGCFPDYAMDVKIESGSGKLVFSAE